MMNARQLLDRLLEDDSVDSMEGVPAWDPLGREAGLRDHPPASAAEARRAGVNWYIKGGRKYTFSQAGSPSGGYPQGSHTIATNRNARLRSFGMADRPRLLHPQLLWALSTPRFRVRRARDTPASRRRWP